MAIGFGGWVRVGLAGAAALLAITGCGEAFTATGGGTTTSTSAGGGGASTTGGGGSTSTGGTTGGTGGSGGTTVMPECMPGETQPCFTVDPEKRNVGICKDGTRACVEGHWGATCDNEVQPATEMCGDDQDFDCDGSNDNGCPCTGDATMACYSGPPDTEGVGTCKHGTQTCMSGVWSECAGDVVPQDENCSNVGADNNCNGQPNDIQGLGVSCDTGKKGICQPGSKKCVGGQLGCVQNLDATTETCDGLDNDCNGVPDDVQGQCMVQLPNNMMCPGAIRCTANGAQCGPITYFGDTFSDSNNNWNLQGEWQIGATFAGANPDQGNPDPSEDHTASNADNKVAGIVIGGNINTEPHGPDYLTTKPFDTNKAGPVFLTYWRWLNSSGLPNMVETVEVATNGSNWTPLANVVAMPVQDSEWVFVSQDVSLYKSATFQVRFGVKVLNQVPEVSSWNIDDVAIISCPPN